MPSLDKGKLLVNVPKTPIDKYEKLNSYRIQTYKIFIKIFINYSEVRFKIKMLLFSNKMLDELSTFL